MRNVYNMALVFRHRVRKDRLINKWFRILDESDLVPDDFRSEGVSSVSPGPPGRPGGVERGLEVGSVRARSDTCHVVHRKDR